MPKKQASLKEIGFVKSFIGSDVPMEVQNEILGQFLHSNSVGDSEFCVVEPLFIFLDLIY